MITGATDSGHVEGVSKWGEGKAFSMKSGERKAKDRGRLLCHVDALPFALPVSRCHHHYLYFRGDGDWESDVLYSQLHRRSRDESRDCLT